MRHVIIGAVGYPDCQSHSVDEFRSALGRAGFEFQHATAYDPESGLLRVEVETGRPDPVESARTARAVASHLCESPRGVLWTTLPTARLDYQRDA